MAQARYSKPAPKPAPEPSPETEPVQTQTAPEPASDGFLKEQVTHARALVRKIVKLSKATDDASKLERYGRAAQCWSEMERKASGRPDPGSFKPVPPRTKGKDRLRLPD